MDQLQSLFKTPAGEYVYDTPQRFKFVASEEGVDNFGAKLSLVMESDVTEQQFTWSMTKPQFDKRFVRKNKDGSLAWAGRIGDTVDVHVIRLKNGFDFFVVTEIGGAVESTGTKVTMLAETMEDPFPAREIGTLKSESLPGAKCTERQMQWRIGRAGILQALIQGGAYNVKDDSELAALEELADSLATSNRRRADDLEQSNPSH